MTLKSPFRGDVILIFLNCSVSSVIGGELLLSYNNIYNNTMPIFSGCYYRIMTSMCYSSYIASGLVFLKQYLQSGMS